MVGVKLKNPDIILMPISNEEKEKYENEFMGDESIYVLYRLPDSEEIQIGMMSTSMKKYFPLTANVGQLDNATSRAFFYNGASDLERRAMEITDRPVYRIRPSDDRTVVGYDVLNGTPENELRIWLEDVVDGRYTINSDISTVRTKRWLSDMHRFLDIETIFLYE